MTKPIVRVLFVIILLQYAVAPSAFAQLTKVKSSYSALTANMAAYWLAKKPDSLRNMDLTLTLSSSRAASPPSRR